MRIDDVTQHIKEVAEQVVLPYFRNLKTEHIAYKIGDDPVTIADKESEIELTKRLSGLLPGSKVLGEEAFSTNPGLLDLFSGESPVWIVDPIDGTRNFAAGRPDFGIIVALSKQNQIVAGWIYDPVSREVVTAEQGSGAWWKGQKLKVLPTKPLEQMYGCLTQRIAEPFEESHNNKALAPKYEGMRAGAHEYPRLVIHESHFGHVSPRSFDFRASLFQTCAWDEAAGVLIHAEAGGHSARWNGQPYDLKIWDQGLLSATDPDSWHALRNWCANYCEFPGM
jgi:fructose-1,6-bisphosphatase/inositol monophosphatase family enzyme